MEVGLNSSRVPAQQGKHAIENATFVSARNHHVRLVRWGAVPVEPVAIGSEITRDLKIWISLAHLLCRAQNCLSRKFRAHQDCRASAHRRKFHHVALQLRRC